MPDLPTDDSGASGPSVIDRPGRGPAGQAGQEPAEEPARQVPHAAAAMVPAAEEPEPLVLPAPVRDRVLALAADCLGSLPPEQVPVALRVFARFTPTKRARLAAVPIAAALEVDAGFRAAVATALRTALPGLATALVTGIALPAAPPEDVAAAAYLLRPDGWRQQVRQVGQALAQRDGVVAGAAQVDAVRRLTEQLAALREAGRAETSRLGSELAAVRSDAVALRRRVRELGDRAGRAEALQRTAERELDEARARLASGDEQERDHVRRLTARSLELERALAQSRQATRERRHAGDLRLRVLLDAMLGAASGLRRELALPPLEGRPADAIAAEHALSYAGPPLQGRELDDPVVLDALLSVPMTHLLVDGYNVTKGGYGELSLEDQRGRLLAGLGALAARTTAEVTAVFDGQERHTSLAVPAPRGVRLIFSRPGQTADEVLLRLVRAEPPGRPVLVVSSDREVADGSRAGGARAVPSEALRRLLGR